MYEIPSNSGRERCRATAKRALGSPADRSVLFSLGMLGKIYAPPGVLDDDPYVEGHDIWLHNLVATEVELRELLGGLEVWLRDMTPADLLLGRASGQEIRGSLGPSEKMISRLDHPVLAIRCSRTVLALEARFVVDQTCVAEWRRGLDSFLSGMTKP